MAVKSCALFCFLLSFHLFLAGRQKNTTLWYDKPAKDWNEALPLGNGRLGAMVSGRADEELIQLNEQRLWTGGPANLNPNPEAPRYLQPVREALLKDSIRQAVNLLHKIQGPDTEMYQPLGDIIIRQPLNGKSTAYYRDLNIARALSTTKFTVDGVEYTREFFSSAPEQVLVIRLRASRPVLREPLPLVLPQTSSGTY